MIADVKDENTEMKFFFKKNVSTGDGKENQQDDSSGATNLPLV